MDNTKSDDKTSQTTGFSSLISEIRMNSDILKFGQMLVTSASKERRSEAPKLKAFKSRFVRLTADGRLTLDDNPEKIQSYIVQECYVAADRVFWLIVKEKTNHKSKRVNNNNEEILARAKDQEDFYDWTMAFETALRLRVEMEELLKGALTEKIKLCEFKKDSMGTMGEIKRKYHKCSYSQGTLWIKDIDGSSTSTTFSVIRINTIYANLCILIETSANRHFVLHLKKRKTFDLWVDHLLCDLEKGPRGQRSVSEVAGELLMGSNFNQLDQVKVKYNRLAQSLEVVDGQKKKQTFQMERVFQMKPNELAKEGNCYFIFMLKSNVKQSKNSLLSTCEIEPLKMYVKIPQSELFIWLNCLEESWFHLNDLLEAILIEIKVRECFITEKTSSETGNNRVSFKEVNELLTFNLSTFKTKLQDHYKWTAVRLDGLINKLLLFLHEPLVPYELHQEFILFGESIVDVRKSKVEHRKKAIKLMNSLPRIRLEIIKKLYFYSEELTQRLPTLITSNADAMEISAYDFSEMEKKRTESTRQKEKRHSDGRLILTSNAVPNSINMKCINFFKKFRLPSFAPEPPRMYINQRELFVFMQLANIVFRFQDQEFDEEEVQIRAIMIAKIFQNYYCLFLKGSKTEQQCRQQ